MRFSEMIGHMGIFCDGDWIEKKDQDANGSVRLIQLADVGEGDFLDKSNRFVNEDTARRLNCTFLQKGDLLISRLGDPLCKACLFPLEGRYITAVDIAVLRIGLPDIASKYLLHLINSPWFKEQVKKYESGTTRKRISRKNLDRIDITIPPLPEQLRIVSRIEELLSELDNCVSTLQKTKEQLVVYRQAVLKDAFRNLTDKLPIRQVSEFVTSGSRGWAKYYADTGARFIRITDLTRDRIILKDGSIQYVDLPENAEGKRSRLEPYDVLVSITADLGSIALVPLDIEEAYINQHIAMIRFDNPNQGEFMAWYLKSDYGQKDLLKNKRGGGKLGLGLDDIRDTSVPHVEDNIANKIVSEIESRLFVCDQIESTVNTTLQQAEAMRQSILKQAFEGRL